MSNQSPPTSGLEHSHDPAAIAERLGQDKQHSYLRDFVFGAIDGAVTTFAVVTGSAGAGFGTEVIIILGLANLLGDGFSMGASNFLGTRTEAQVRERARAMERRHIAKDPDGEREEIRQLFKLKGFQGSDLERAVEIVTADEDRWVDTMVMEELGLSLHGGSPWKAASVTFGAFCLIGFLPLVVFLLGLFIPISEPAVYWYSTAITAAAFFVVGAFKSLFVDQHWTWSGLETLAVGGTAALLAYLAGWTLSGLVG